MQDFHILFPATWMSSEYNTSENDRTHENEQAMFQCPQSYLKLQFVLTRNTPGLLRVIPIQPLCPTHSNNLTQGDVDSPPWCATLMEKLTFVVSIDSSYITPVREITKELVAILNVMIFQSTGNITLDVSLALICIYSSVCFYMHISVCMYTIQSTLLYIVITPGGK